MFDPYAARLLAWTRACQQKRHGSPPDWRDVAREVRRLLPAAPDQDSDTAYRAYRKLLESAQSEYKKAHAMLEEGELDGFLAATDKMSKRQKTRLVAMLGKLAAALSRDALILQGEVPEEEPPRSEESERSRQRDLLPDLLFFRHYGEVAVLPVM